MKNVTPSQLKQLHNNYNPGNCFFDSVTMKFFGDTMRNYGVRVIEHEGEELFELYRKKPVKGGLTSSAYFNAVGKLVYITEA